MSNARVFAWGWLLSATVLAVLDWLGFGQHGLSGAAWRMLINLHVGVVAIAMFGDRRALAEAGK